MSVPKTPAPAMLIIGLLHRPDFDLLPLRERLERDFGAVGEVSERLPFDFSDYYEAEMGPNLQRCFFVFEEFIDPGRLVKIKLVTNIIENDF